MTTPAPAGPHARRCLYAALTAALLLVLTGGALARGAGVSTKVLRLHPAFERLGTASYVVSDGRYTFAGAAFASPHRLGTLYDERARTHTRLAPPAACAGPTGPLPTGDAVLGGDRLAIECSDAETAGIWLYRPARATWTAVAMSPRIEASCTQSQTPNCVLTGVGRDWLQFGLSCYHCATTEVFQDLQTGVTRPAPGSPRVTTDLNSARLTRTLCPALRRPAGGQIDLEGALGVVSGPRGAYLQRCGSRFRRRLPALAAVSQQAVIWGAGPRRLAGLRLPDLRPFTLAIPARVAAPDTVTLTPRYLYLLDRHDVVWRTPFHPR